MTLLYDVPKDWELLAEVDNSESYEVDITAIYRDDKGKVFLATASGCSCWGGEYDAEEFDTIDDLAASIAVTSGAERRYWISPRGAEELLAEARKNL